MKRSVGHKILIVTERFFPEEFIINELSRELAKDHSVTILTQNPSYPLGRLFSGYGNPLVSVSRWQGIRVVRGLTILGYQRNLILKMLNYLWFAVYNSLLALFVAPGVDRIFVFHTGPLSLAVPAAIAARVFNIPMVVWTQDVWPDSVFAYGFSRRPALEYCLSEFVRWIYRRTRTVLISSEGFLASVQRHAPRSSIAYAPNWSTYSLSAQPDQSKREPKRNGDRSFLFAGNIGKVQNLEMIIRAFGELEKITSGVRLDIVGDGSNLAQLKRLVSLLGCQKVVFHGRVPVDRIGEYYIAADFLVISLIKRPIFALTVPSKFQSYLVAGKPILAAMDGEVARLVREHSLGIAVSPDDEPAILGAMTDLIDIDARECAAICHRAQSLLESDFSKIRIINTIRKALA